MENIASLRKMKTAQHYLKVKSLKHRLKLLVETPFYRTTLNKSKPCTRRRLLFFVMYVMLIRIWSQGSANCSILPSQMEKKHGLSWENMEHKENAENIANMENINQKTKKTRFFIHSTLFVTQNTLFANLMTTQNTLIYGFYVDSRKNHKLRAKGCS